MRGRGLRASGLFCNGWYGCEAGVQGVGRRFAESYGSQGSGKERWFETGDRGGGVAREAYAEVGDGRRWSGESREHAREKERRRVLPELTVQRRFEDWGCSLCCSIVAILRIQASSKGAVASKRD